MKLYKILEILMSLLLIAVTNGATSEVNPDGKIWHPSINGSYIKSIASYVSINGYDVNIIEPTSPHLTLVGGYVHQKVEIDRYHRSFSNEIHAGMGGFIYYSQSIQQVKNLINPDGVNNSFATSLQITIGNEIYGGGISTEYVFNDHLTSNIAAILNFSNENNTYLLRFSQKIHLFNSSQNLKYFNPNGSPGTLTLIPNFGLDFGDTETNIAGITVFMPFNRYLSQAFSYNHYLGADEKYIVFTFGLEVSF